MNIKHFLYTLLYICALFSCSHDDDDTQSEVKIRRTIIAYVCGDNNLSNSLQDDIMEMVKGAATLPTDCRLIVFTDFLNTTPYIYEIQNGQRTTVKKFSEEFYCTNPDSMLHAMQWIADNYPADEYALLMTGHGNGSIIEQDTVGTIIARRYAYGLDTTGDKESGSYATWLNIPTFASVLSQLNDKNGAPLHFDYIFFDCCCMQTAEVAYELRNYTDYIVAAASEVPGKGAPYNKIVPILGVDKEIIGKEIIDNYIEGTQWGSYGGIAISAVKTSEMESLMNATRKALKSIYTGDKLTLNRYRCIYYFRDEDTDKAPALHDLKNIMHINLDNAAYNEWLPFFTKAVVASYMPTGSAPWNTVFEGLDFNSFDITEENYGGISMIAPNIAYDNIEKRATPMKSLNKTMFNYEWCNDIGWHELGW